MRDGTDSTAVVRVPEPEGFGNRKLIRPSLNRAQSHVTEAVGERRERTVRNSERVTEHAPQRSAPGVPLNKPAPAEQTHAENFYYLKQIQTKTPMVVVTRDGEEVRGIIEWYDKSCFKLNRANGQSNVLIYKASVRYMFKEGEETK
jgi:hypothetical protein